MKYLLFLLLIFWTGSNVNADAAAASSSSDVVVLRDGAQEIAGTILSIDIAGIQISSKHKNSSLITWDRIRGIETESEDKLTEYKSRKGYAENLWRARTRVERGDYLLAEPLFENMYADALGRTDESAYIIMEGLLRCNVARQNPVAAVIPWLECLRLRAAGVTRVAYLDMPEIIDSNTGLCGAIPPVWYVYQANIEKLYNDLAAYVPADSLKVRHLALLYWESVGQVFINDTTKKATNRLQNNISTLSKDQFQAQSQAVSGERGDTPDKLLTLREISLRGNLGPAGNGDEGILIVTAIVKACEPETSADDLEGSIKVLTRWARFTGWPGSWARFGRGMARSWSSDEEDLKKALVDLLYLPATRNVDPNDIEVKDYLLGFALKQAANTLDSLGRIIEAESLRIELVNQYKNHPLNKSRLRINKSVPGEIDS